MHNTRRKLLMKLIEKRGFSPAGAMGGQMDPSMMGGGAPPAQPPMDPAAMQGAMPPMDPSMGGGMAAAGGAPPVDPATGMPMDPAAMGGGAPPVDPATGMPMDPAAMGGGADPMTMPITNLTVGDLVSIIGEVVTQAMGGGGGEAAAPAAEEPQGEAEGTKATENDVVDRLDQILALLSGGAPGAEQAPMQPMGPEAGPIAPEAAGQGPKLASHKVGRTSVADMVLQKMSSLR